MFNTEPVAQRGRKPGLSRGRDTDLSPELVLDEAVDAVQRLLRGGYIDQQLADVLMRMLLAGYVNYTIHQEIAELTDYILETFADAEMSRYG